MIIIDTFNLIYRAAGVACSKPENELVNKSVHKTFLQIFFKMFNKIYRENKLETIILTWEENVDNFRKELYPEYKANRGNSLKEKVEGAFSEIKKGLLNYGCIIVEHNKAEGDDLVYSICMLIKEDIKIISSDKDFTQLLKLKNVKVFNPIKECFLEKPEYDYVKARALEGDDSDNIKGLPGFGPKKSKNVLNNFDTFYKTLSEENKKLIETNINIMDLSKNPFKDEISLAVKEQISQKTEFSAEKIRKFYFDNKLIELYGNFRSELGAFF